MEKPDPQTTTDLPPVAPEDMFYGGLYWVWDVPGLGLRCATPGECAAEIKRLRTALSEVAGIWDGDAEPRRFVDRGDKMRDMAREALKNVGGPI